MRKGLILALAIGTIFATTGANAQQGVVKAQHPTITATGHFNNALVSSTTTKAYTASTSGMTNFPRLYTTLDTVNGASGVDTFKLALAGDYNSVTFQWNLTKIGGRVDSFLVTYWGSVDGVNYVSLSTATATNTTGTKAYAYLINSGAGNVYTHYMLTAACTNAAANSSGSWRGYVLVR